MKKLFSLVICVVALLFIGCEPNAPATSNKVETVSASEITQVSAILHGKVNVDISLYDDVEFGMMVSDNKDDLNTRVGEMYKAKVLKGKDFELTLSNLYPNTKYYYCAWLFLNNTQYEYGGIKRFGTKKNSDSGNTGNQECVDLGLSVKWATCNVGANTPEEYGDYFAWGEIKTKKNYSWGTYKYCNNLYDSLTKYNNTSRYGTVDNKTQLDLTDDAAHANWGGSWRMPTHAEVIELLNNCTWTWIAQNGVRGYKVISNKNGNSIFFPAAGYYYNSSLYGSGSCGNYWSSSLLADSPHDAYDLYLGSGSVYRYYYYRYYGFTVRPVCQ